MRESTSELNIPEAGLIFAKINSVKSPKGFVDREKIGPQGFGAQVDEYLYDDNGRLQQTRKFAQGAFLGKGGFTRVFILEDRVLKN